MEKLYYSIGEVAKELDLQPHVLRYWETEFPQLKPGKGKAGTRLYRKEDIKLLRTIKKLLHEDRYTIEGAVIKLNEQKDKTVQETNQNKNDIEVDLASPSRNQDNNISLESEIERIERRKRNRVPLYQSVNQILGEKDNNDCSEEHIKSVLETMKSDPENKIYTKVIEETRQTLREILELLS